MDAVIVGGGLGGLSAAVCLAARGLDVTVLEASDRWGGKANTMTVDGVSFDTGPSLITLLDSLDAVFREAGTCLADQVSPREVDGGFRMVFEDAEVVLGHGLDGALDGIEKGLGVAARDEAAAFLSYSQTIWTEVAPRFIWSGAPSALSFFKLGPAHWVRLLKADPFRTMWSAICARVTDPHLRAIFARFATYNGSDPRRAPATLNCIAWVELGLGGYGLEGGVHTLVEALVRVGTGLGVDFRLSTPVRQFLTDSGGICGVETDTERLATRVVVCNADVSHLATQLLPGVMLPTREPSTSGWTAVVRAHRRPRAGHEVLFHQPYLAEFEDIFDARRIPENPTLYICAQEKAHARVGWAEHEPLFVMLNAPAGSGTAEGVREKALARLLQAGVVDPQDRVVWEKSPAGLAAQFPGSMGALYGAASNSQFAAFKRPANRVAKVPGLYLASGGAHPGGGVPLVMQSGRVAAAHALQDARFGRGS